MSNEKITLTDVYKLLQNVNTNLNSRMENLEQTCQNICSSLQNEISLIKRKYEEIEKENITLKEKLENIEKKYKNNNIILYGVEETEIETQKNLVKTVRKIFDEILNVKTDISEINKIHRIGKIRNKIRPILISFTTYLRKAEIFKTAYKFKGSTYSISPDLTIKEQQQRRELVNELKKAKNAGKTAYIKNNTLYVDGNKHTFKEVPTNEIIEIYEQNIDNNIPSPIFERKVASEPATPSPKEIEEEEEYEEQKEEIHQPVIEKVVSAPTKQPNKPLTRTNSHREPEEKTPTSRGTTSQKRPLRKLSNK